MDDGRARKCGPDLGLRLSAARKKAGVGLRALAREIGVSAGLISQVENGKIAPPVSTLYAIATTLGPSFDYLFRGPDHLGDSPAPAGASFRTQHETERRQHLDPAQRRFDERRP